MRLRFTATLILIAFVAVNLRAHLSRVQPADAYKHDRFVTQPVDIQRDFTAFTLSFDGLDDGLALGVPEWVAYELRAAPPNLGRAPERPSRWSTDVELHSQKIAPDDASYKDSGYSRGYMCMKSHAHRLSESADMETHTVLNACPQMQGMNAGIWLAVENLTGKWADAFGRVWIITGPVFINKTDRKWIGAAGEVPVAVPDAFFKIVVKENSGAPEVLAFLVPMEGDDSHSKQTADVRPYLTSVDVVEALTGLDFLTALPDPLENHLEQRLFTALWESSSPVLAERPPPEEGPRVQAAPPTIQIALRDGITPTAAEQKQASQIKSAGWEYTMPRPKSPQAAWGNRDGRTTWWNGYWKNAKTGRYSSAQPTESDGFAGDGISNAGWRRGGSPGAPSRIEWLCSTSGGIAPR